MSEQFTAIDLAVRRALETASDRETVADLTRRVRAKVPATTPAQVLEPVKRLERWGHVSVTRTAEATLVQRAKGTRVREVGSAGRPAGTIRAREVW